MADLDLSELDVNVYRCLKLLRRAWPRLVVASPEAYGPSGFSFAITDRSLIRNGSIIITQLDFDGDVWIHASIRWNDRDPNAGDLALLKEAVFGPGREAYQIYPPTLLHSTPRKHQLSLWGRADGKPALPEFGDQGAL